MITFCSRVTEKGNFKADPQVLDILGVKPGDKVNISVELADDDDGNIHIPQEILEAAGIDESRGLEVYTDEGCVVISEAEYDDE